jgi:phosphonate transport system substrate-binding protein
MRSKVMPRGAIRSLIILGYVAMTLAACGKGAGPGPPPNKGVIRFSVSSAGPVKAVSQDWAPVLADMAARTGLKVEPYYAVGETQQADAMRRGKTDAGWFSNTAGLQAVRRGGGEVFVSAFANGNSDSDLSLLIVNARSRLTLPRVLKCDRTLTISFGEARSVSATLAPTAYLFAPAGVDPKRCFRQVRAASPAINLLAVAHRHVDLATEDLAWLENPAQAARPEARDVRVLWRSPPLPGDPIIWRRTLDPAVKEKLRQFFLTYGHGESPPAQRQRANLARLGVAGFQPADNNHLLLIREMEAAQAWVLAKEGGDRVGIAAAQKALDNIRAQREALEGRTRAPAAAQ